MSCSPINNHRVRKWYLVMKTLFIKMVRIGVTLLRCYVFNMENEGPRAFKEIWFSPSPSPRECSKRIGDKNIWFSAMCEDFHLVKVTGVTLSHCFAFWPV